MSAYEMVQWAGLGVGLMVLGAIVFGIARSSRQQRVPWPNCARLCLAYAGMPTRHQDLEVPIRLVIAAAGARLT